MTLWKNIYQKMLSNVPSNIFQKRIFNSGVIRQPPLRQRISGWDKMYKNSRY
ncbi:hypothetical protein GARC_1223 [Paraglaciecola arctica BSs20135]|uniref:Uncharacterized protein n=1 Tax=Paraglaciecola arctica BSs20135 TaxID=493475 RepID=K6YNI4_9ALTE|nr:hypothetical protein GARC_1223 [Paraglaciecola arctica BSs20135]